MHTDVVLQAFGLKKYYKTVHAVEDISFSVTRGEIFGFLGPNGSGKTTTIGMLLGLVRPTAGRVELFGQEISPLNVRPLRHVGALVESPALVPYLSAADNLALLSYLYPHLPAGRIHQVLDMVGLNPKNRRAARHFSTGMKQRLGLALALLKDPELLILDEPTNGLDPVGMHEVRILLRSLADQGMTIFLSSHLLHEMELICDRVLVIQHGTVIAHGKVADLLGNTQQGVRITTDAVAKTIQILGALPGIHNIEAHGNAVEVRGISSKAALDHLVRNGITPDEVSVTRSDLESVFLKLTGHAS